VEFHLLDVPRSAALGSVCDKLAQGGAMPSPCRRPTTPPPASPPVSEDQNGPHEPF
jgi:hypothetical protein